MAQPRRLHHQLLAGGPPTEGGHGRRAVATALHGGAQQGAVADPFQLRLRQGSGCAGKEGAPLLQLGGGGPQHPNRHPGAHQASPAQAQQQLLAQLSGGQLAAEAPAARLAWLQRPVPLPITAAELQLQWLAELAR